MLGNNAKQQILLCTITCLFNEMTHSYWPVYGVYKGA